MSNSNKGNKRQKQAPKPSIIEREANKLKPNNFTLQQAKQSFKDRDANYQQAVQAVQSLKRPIKQYDHLVGRKMRNAIIKELDLDLTKLTTQDQKALDFLLIEDDFITGLKNMAMTAGKYIKPLIKPVLSTIAPELMPIVEMLIPQQQISQSSLVNRSESVRLRRRYLLRNVTQLITQQVQAIDINPGLQVFGQWLSIVSRAYQFYEVHSLTFEYVTATSLTTPGNIAYYLEMDKNAAIPGVNDIGQQYKSSTHALYENGSVTYSQDEIHQMVKRFHIRNESVNPDEYSMYDVGTFYYVSSAQSTNTYGQFYVDIDITLHIPTLQGLQNSVISQYSTSISLQDFTLPQNNLFEYDATQTRLIQTYTMKGYRISVSGTIYGLSISYGTNANAINPLSMYTASDITAVTSSSSIIKSQVANTAGDRIYIMWTSIVVQAGSVLWIARSGAGETASTYNAIYLTYGPNAFPILPIAVNVQALTRKQLSQEMEDYRIELAKKEQLVQNRLDKQQRIIQQLLKNKITQRQVEEEDETEFSF